MGGDFLTTRKERLLADIGGTNIRLAIQTEGSQPRRIRVLQVGHYSSLDEALTFYLSKIDPKHRPTEAAFAIAAPVTADRVTMTNCAWSFSLKEVQRRHRLDRLEVINDFAAAALAIPSLSPKDRRKVGRGRAARDAPVVVIGPGTGLGIGYLVPSPSGWLPIQTEGGHITVPPYDDRESRILALLRREFGHVSAERVISGPGLSNLYRAIAELEERRPRHRSPAAITRRALDGNYPIATRALDTFCAMLGTVASNLVLSLGARGGVYIAGGIIPKLGDAFSRSRFRHRFEQKGRLSAYVRAIPTYVITHPLPALLGLSRLLDRR